MIRLRLDQFLFMCHNYLKFFILIIFFQKSHLYNHQVAKAIKWHKEISSFVLVYQSISKSILLFLLQSYHTHPIQHPNHPKAGQQEISANKVEDCDDHAQNGLQSVWTEDLSGQRQHECNADQGEEGKDQDKGNGGEVGPGRSVCHLLLLLLMEEEFVFVNDVLIVAQAEKGKESVQWP